MSENLTGFKFVSAYEKYVFYNFHRKEFLDDMIKVITLDKKASIVILSGEDNIGKEYFLEAAAYQASQEISQEVLIFPFKLKGFENSLEDFINFQIKKEEEIYNKKLSDKLKAFLEDFKKSAPNTWATFFGASFVSMLFNMSDKQIGWIKKNIINPSDKTLFQRFDDKTILDNLFEKLTEKEKIIIKINRLECNLPIIGWLRDLALRNRNVTLAITCKPDDDIRIKIDPDAKLRLEFNTLNLQELKAIINYIYKPNSFSDDLYNALWNKYQGNPKNLLFFMRKLVQEEIIFEEKGKWRLIDEGFESEKCAELFAGDFYTPISEFIDKQDDNIQHLLTEFLQIAALCGENVPVNALLDFMNLEEDEPVAEQLLDIIDDNFVFDGEHIDKTGLKIFIDYEYNHPSFPKELKQSVYSFINPIYNKSIIAHITNPENKANSLAYIIKEKIPIISKGIMRLFISLFDYADNDKEKTEYDSLLLWWIGIDETDYLKDHLIEEMKAGNISGELVWAIFLKTENIWPPYRREVLLDVYANQPDGIPIDMIEDCYYYKSKILYQLGKYKEAASIAGYTYGLLIKQGKDNSSRMGRICNILGLILLNQNKLSLAKKKLQKALDIHLKLYGEEHPNTAKSFGNLASVFKDEGDLENAKIYYQKALDIFLKIYDEEHPHTATSFNNLGLLLKDERDLENAKIYHQKALDIYLKIYGEEHPHTSASFGNLALVLEKEGDLENAKIYFQKALDIRLKIFGEEHPHTILAKKHLDDLEKIEKTEEKQ
jgi:Tfp pilus assembly protein PilF